MPPFRGNHLKSYTDTMTAVAQAAIASWPRGEPVRLHPLMQSLTLEVILRVVFGLNEGARLDQLRVELVRTLAAADGLAGQMLLVLGPRQTRAMLIRKLFALWTASSTPRSTSDAGAAILRSAATSCRSCCRPVTKTANP